MTIDLESLQDVKRLLFKIPVGPLQGNRFQPTGFPSLGPATFQTASSTNLLVESAQSMANHLEATIWDAANNDVEKELNGLSHVRVKRNGSFLTDTILESHRLNSPYLLEGTDTKFFDTVRSELEVLKKGPIDRQKLAEVLLKYDINSLLHGVFLVKKKLAGGRLRLARALSAFIEADNVQVAPSGGVKNDHVNPSGDPKSGFGNVLFARDEYTAERITLYVNLDLVQIRGYRLGDVTERLLILLSLYKIRKLTTDGMRLRTACDLKVLDHEIKATMPEGWGLPALDDFQTDLKRAIEACKHRMTVTSVTFEDDLTEGNSSNEDRTGTDDDDTGDLGG